MTLSKTQKATSLIVTAAIFLLFTVAGSATAATKWSKTIDFGDEGYKETGNAWRSYFWPPSHNHSYRYLSYWEKNLPRLGTATWETEIPFDGLYKVETMYLQTENRTPDANYSVTDNDGKMKEIIVNQRGNGHVDVITKNLGQYKYTKGQKVKVVLDGTDDNFSDSADASIWTLVEKYLTVNSSASKGGTINPRGMVSVTEGKTQKFTIAPVDNYTIANVYVDGKDVGPVTSYTFTNVTKDHTIRANFETDVVLTPNSLLLLSK